MTEPSEALPATPSTGGVVHLSAPILRGPADEVDQAWLIAGRISYEKPSTATEVTTVTGYVIPGLVDAHCHVGLVADGAADRQVAREQAVRDRDAGSLLIRDAGSPTDTRWMDDEPDLPVIVRAGRHIARTRRYIRGFAAEVEPADLAAEMTRQAGLGDGWVKIVGDWIDRDLGDLAPCWPADALQAGIAAAHRAGARVTAHCFGEDCLPDLIAVGIDGIEHGCGLTADTIAAAAAHRVALVPTLVNIATFPDLAAPARGKFDLWADHMLALYERRHATIGAAHEAGVPIYAGTDAGSAMPHGLIVSELIELTRAGLSRVEALDAGCWAARRWLGRPGLDEGDPGDLLVLRDDPRTDLSTLADPVHIVLRGTPVGG